MHPRLWILLHAPPKPSDDHLWCDFCDSWQRRTYRLPPTINSAGLVSSPSIRSCHTCAVKHWDGNAESFLRWTTETKAREEAYLSLITHDQIEAKIADFVAELRTRVNMPGFRPGHAPAHMIRNRFSDLLVTEAMEELLIEALRKAVGPVDHQRPRESSTQQEPTAQSQDGAR